MSSFDPRQFGNPGMQGMPMGRPDTRFAPGMGQSPLGSPLAQPNGGTEGSIQNAVLGNVAAATAAGISPAVQNPAMGGLAAPMNPMNINPSMAPNMMGGLGQAAGGMDPYTQAALVYQQMQAQGGIQPDMGNVQAMQDMPPQSRLQRAYGHARTFAQENGLDTILKEQGMRFAAGAIAGEKFGDNLLARTAEGYKQAESEMGGTETGELMAKARGQFGNLFKNGKMNAGSVSALAGTAGAAASMFGGPYGQAAGAALSVVSMGAGLLADNKKDSK